MSREEELKHLKEEYNSIRGPESGLKRIENAVAKAKVDKMEKRKKKTRIIIRNWGIGAAAVFILVLLPNTNRTMAYAMGNLPVIGGFFQVITIKDYNYEDEHNQANVKVPEIVTSDSDSGSQEAGGEIEKINKSVEEYTSELVAKFQSDMVQEGYSGLDISYDTITNTDQWFTLVIYAVETQASGNEFRRYYHFDKTKGQVVTLENLFQENTDYITVISDEIKKQMKEQMDAGQSSYWLEDDEYTEGFKAIAKDQNFYFNEDGNIVIVFDEYQVGPGYIGCPEFVIPSDLIKDIRK